MMQEKNEKPNGQSSSSTRVTCVWIGGLLHCLHIIGTKVLSQSFELVYSLSGDVSLRRGRKKCNVWRCQLFLLGKSNDDFVPSPSEQLRLTRNGLG